MLKTIVDGYEYQLIRGSLMIPVLGIEQDSRLITIGKMFVAIDGFTVDGHDFINSAINRGANCIVFERDVKVDEEGITVLKVEDTIDALARFSHVYYGKPSTELNLIAITGTNGKTSVSYIIKNIFEKKQIKIGIIGTMGMVIDNRTMKIANTTPESCKIQQNLRKMVSAGIRHCIMEVSSHALALKRVEYLDFQIGIFTNLTEDHLDYHKTMEEYYSCKLKLFDRTTKCNIINGDDPYGFRILKETKNNIPIVTYGMDKEWDVYATDINYHKKGVDFTLHCPKGSIPIKSTLFGKFNVYNSLAAAACTSTCNMSLHEIKTGLETVPGIKGRFESLAIGKDYHVIIDFAHTPDGLKKVLTAIGKFAKGQKIIVFGAGGNRDKEKRPLMGEMAAKYADLCIITSDNPRFENPRSIMDDIRVGVERAKGHYQMITDRREAIEYALSMAGPGDVILLAGKGHETHTIIEGNMIPFDERKIVLDILNK